jgi:uncharacterized protein with FMN-binding domain
MRVKWWVVALGTFIIIPSVIGFSVWNSMRSVKDLTVSDNVLVDVPDGMYEGEMDTALIRARVRVEIRDAKIADITILVHDNGRGSAAEAITDEIIRNQSLAVDTISGATLSSKVILKAVEAALLQSKN